MSYQTTYPRKMLGRDGDRKKRKLSIDDSAKASDMSVLTEKDINTSEIQNVQDGRSTSLRDESKTNAKRNDDINSRPILEGVVGFVDYKFGRDRSGSPIKNRLLGLGAKVAKTFNQKVTHVVFCDGFRSTYDKAIERNVPLVSARWIEFCVSAKMVLDPVDYPPANIDKYKETPKKKYSDIPVSKNYKKFLGPSNAVRDQLFKDSCEKLIEKFYNIKAEQTYKNTEHSPIIEDPHKTTVNQKDDCGKNDILNTLSNKLYTVLNESDGPVHDDQIDELCIPISIRELRKCLIPSKNKTATPTELDSELAKIEDRLSLNDQARKRFRHLLFPSDKDSNDISNITDFPSKST